MDLLERLEQASDTTTRAIEAASERMTSNLSFKTGNINEEFAEITENIHHMMTGKLDRLIPWQHAQRLANEVKGPCTFLLIEDGNHVANNRAYRWRAQSADWLKEQLA